MYISQWHQDIALTCNLIKYFHEYRQAHVPLCLDTRAETGELQRLLRLITLGQSLGRNHQGNKKILMLSGSVKWICSTNPGS